MLAAGGATVGARPMLATTFAANALSASVPLAGPELGTAFTFRRYTGQGADAPLAAWSLLVGGVASAAAGALLIAAGLLAGRPATTHHVAHADLAAAGAELRPDKRVVDDGNVLTAAGVTSGLDLALWIVEREAGRQIRDVVADEMEYPARVA